MIQNKYIDMRYGWSRSPFMFKFILNHPVIFYTHYSLLIIPVLEKITKKKGNTKKFDHDSKVVYHKMRLAAKVFLFFSFRSVASLNDFFQPVAERRCACRRFFGSPLPMLEFRNFYL